MTLPPLTGPEKDNLRLVAEEAQELPWPWSDFYEVATPWTVLALLDEIETLHQMVEKEGE